jgi:hypothetical protein
VQNIKYFSLLCACVVAGSRDSSVGIPMGWTAGGLIPGRIKKFFSTPQGPDQIWGPPNGYHGAEFPGGKAVVA